MYFVSKDPIKFNNTINTSLINSNIILYHVLSLNIYENLKYHQHQYYHNQHKIYIHVHLIQNFFKLSFEILSKKKKYGFILDFFYFELINFSTVSP